MRVAGRGSVMRERIVLLGSKSKAKPLEGAEATVPSAA